MKKIRKILLLSAAIIAAHSASPVSGRDDTVSYSAELLSRYISYESVSGNEREAGEFLSGLARDKGLVVEILTDGIDRFNFTASLYPLELGKPNIILLNHIDVVPPGDFAAWKNHPFSGEIDDGYVWGRGAIDNKGMAIMQLLALSEFAEKARQVDYPYNVTMLSVSGEETGGHTGSRIIVRDFLEKLNPVVLYGEGGSGLPDLLAGNPEKMVFGISVAHKRTLWLRLTINSQTSGHGSVPPETYAIQEKVNALNNLYGRKKGVYFSETTYNMFRELGKLESGFRGFALRNIRFFKPLVMPSIRKEEIVYSLVTNTITVTAVNTPPGPPNQIPQSVTAVLDCRLLPGIETEDFLKKIERVMDNDGIIIEVMNEGVMANPSPLNDHYLMIEKAVKEAYHSSGVIPVIMPASNDNNFFRSKGVPSYGILPVFLELELLESIHNVNERMPVDMLERGTDTYMSLIRQYLYP